ncbi:MAG TPA: DUF6101 family protein [Afifellaceae bacterium]|nr:DUF6101 family protein [Afifellaceae bacterium]
MDHSVMISGGSDTSATDVALAAAANDASYHVVTGDGEACELSFDQKTLVIERMVANLTCTITIPAAFYEGVALVVGETDYSVRLENRDPGLTMIIDGLPNLGKAMDLRDDLARLLRLPAMTVSRDGEVAADEYRLGGLTVRDGLDRRASMAMRRRPRFLARRKAGRARRAKPYARREIIARD